MEAPIVDGTEEQKPEPEAAAPGPAEGTCEFPEVSDELVLFILSETALQGQLRGIAQQQGLARAPGELPFETKRALVAALIEQAGGSPQAPQEREKRGSWRFWRRWSLTPVRRWLPVALLLPMAAAPK